MLRTRAERVKPTGVALGPRRYDLILVLGLLGLKRHTTSNGQETTVPIARLDDMIAVDERIGSSKSTRRVPSCGSSMGVCIRFADVDRLSFSRPARERHRITA